MIDLLNKVEPPATAIVYCVPTRIIRVVQTDATMTTFRVEQLVEHGGFGGQQPTGAWKTLSLHTDPREGAAFAVALNAAWKAQGDLVAKLKRRMADRMNVPQNLRAR